MKHILTRLVVGERKRREEREGGHIFNTTKDRLDITKFQGYQRRIYTIVDLFSHSAIQLDFHIHFLFWHIMYLLSEDFLELILLLFY